LQFFGEYNSERILKINQLRGRFKGDSCRKSRTYFRIFYRCKVRKG